jgi:DNA-binding MarR family transcriptional regulator
MNADALKKFFADATLGAPENAVGFVLWRLVHRYQRAVDRELASLDLTHLQFTILALVAWANRSGQRATQSELSRAGDIQPMQISQILKVLEVKGVIIRVQSAANARAKCVEITRGGLTVLRSAMPIAIGVQQRMFGEAGMPGGRLLKELRRSLDASPD